MEVFPSAPHLPAALSPVPPPGSRLTHLRLLRCHLIAEAFSDHPASHLQPPELAYSVTDHYTPADVLMDYVLFVAFPAPLECDESRDCTCCLYCCVPGASGRLDT